MRQVVVDTETTGLEASKGHRIVEIGCVELFERRRSGRKFHRYLNPQRVMDEGARAVTGISDEFLLDKPLFAQIADELIEFLVGAELIIHNAAFDVSFFDAEFARLGGQHGKIADHATVLDTLALAREKFPGQKNNLNALCKRLNVDNGHRDLHGALLDAELLAEVYLAMTAGQGDLGFGAQNAAASVTRSRSMVSNEPGHVALRVRRADGDELAAHAQRLAAIDKSSKGKVVWQAASPALSGAGLLSI